jgi:hypothetical protein
MRPETLAIILEKERKIKKARLVIEQEELDLERIRRAENLQLRKNDVR